MFNDPLASQPAGLSDVCGLPSIAEDTVLALLRERYISSHPYTALSSHALISVNPFGHQTTNGDQALQDYMTEYHESSIEDTSLRGGEIGPAERQGPHIFRTAYNAYYNMERTKQDQVIILSGVTGSGKSEMKRLATRAICELSAPAPGKRGSKIGAQVANAEFILESFGHAHTLSGDNASRYGNYTELQFSDNGHLEGLKSIEYYFERSRASHAPSVGERNFHVFYYLVSGIRGEERNHLKLHDVHDYRYLQSRVRRSGPGDQHRFDQLKQAFRIVGLSTRLVAQICQLLSVILHIGNLQFQTGHGTQEGSVATSSELLDLVADFLGVTPGAMAELFAVKTVLVRKEICTSFLEPEEAEAVRDELACTLYSLLFSWLNEHLNQKLCKDSFASFIAILDLPGPQSKHGSAGEVNSIDQFCFNVANEKVYNWVLQRVHVAAVEEFQQDNLAVARFPHFDNTECVNLLGNPRGGLIHIMDDHARKCKTETSMLEAMGKRHNGHASFALDPPTPRAGRSFTINHYSGSVSYSTEHFLEQNANETSADVLRLLRGNSATPRSFGEHEGSNNPFVRSLFASKAIATRLHPRNEDTIVAVQQSVKPMRAPSTRRKRSPAMQAILEADTVDSEDVGGGNDEGAAGQALQCIAGQHWSAVQTLLETFEHAQAWYVFCLKPNDSQLCFQMDIRAARFQIRSLGLTELASRLKTACEVRMTHAEACDRYQDELCIRGIAEGLPEKQRLADLQRVLRLSDTQMAIGSTRIYLSHGTFHRLEDRLRVAEFDASGPHDGTPAVLLRSDPFSPYALDHSPAPSPGLPMHDAYDREGSNLALPLVANAQPLRQASPDPFEQMDDRVSSFGRATAIGDTASIGGTDRYAPSKNMFQSMDYKEEKDVLDLEPSNSETTEVYRESIGRRRWVWLCAVMTFWIPGFLLSGIGGMKRPDVRQAWREKLTINLIIWSICLSTIFVIAALGPIICPTQHVYSTSELNSHSFKNNPNNALIAIRGEVFDLTQFVPTHLAAVSVVPTKSVLQYGGLDASNLFPVQVNALCGGTTGALSPWVTLDSTNTTDPYMKYHDFRAFTNDSRPDWYSQMMVMLRHRFRVGFMGYTKKDIKNMVQAGRAVTIIDGMVYEITTYISQNGGGLRAPNGTELSATDQQDRRFLADQVTSLFTYESGKDVTQLLDNLAGDIGADVVARQKQCLRNLFLIGEVDTRDSAQCQFSTYILLALSIVMVSIIGFKFIAAIHFGSSRAPENHDKFVICQVPCYTESEESLRRTIDSLARLKYDDKRKLLMIVCDGNIKGFGNDKATPAIVLDILGVDPNLDPEPLSFQSLGEGSKQHNMGKVYAGLYECAGHVVPYMVIVKVGKPTERPKPGNRGKRDSQMILMHFLNKVHYNAPMNPLELEMYHQMKNVVGVSPTFYEYLFMVDADTTVEELSLNRLVSAMMHDKKIIGACGETSITNAKQSIVTMSQVYEYFISHHLAKSFESLFGSITCLPGCFSMYRLRTPDSHKPLFISNQIVHDYAENRVDTLHLKNLLHLGEDRYLTTLVLKHFPTHKTKFVRDAHAQTVAPDSASVLLSQRRRWINSTVHNLAELVFLDQLCGFCCFSMRFVVFIDLLSTIVAPVTVAYIGYLIYLVVHTKASIPILSIVMLAAIYGLQALVFIFRMRWDMIAWMIFYILAIPVFSFFLPLYSFWKMDDFSWGTTRLVVGEKGKKIVIHDEGKFDVRSIPLKSWSDYENELWEQDADDRSLESFGPPDKSRYTVNSRPPSSYGGNPLDSPHVRALSSAASYPELRNSAYEIHHLGYDSRLPFLPSHSQNSGIGERGSGRNAYGGVNAYGEVEASSGDQEHRAVHADEFNAPVTFQPFAHTSPAPHQDRPMSAHLSERGHPIQAFFHGESPSRQDRLFRDGPAEHGPGERDMLQNGSSAITGAALHASITRICSEADLETMTKRSVRRQLEQEYGVDLGERKDEISRIVEAVMYEEVQVE